jgi:adenylate cyclase
LTGERIVRRLAAILAADVVGYSRLMGRDENGTLARLKAHRTERFEPPLARHGGRLVKLSGDGALVEFASAVDALGAAIEFQQAMAAANKDQPEDTAIVFRIGLHLGDLIVEGDDLYGDGVNVAARLEGEAPPGGIVISGDVHNAVAGRLKAAFDDLGSLVLKNIERPLQAYEVKWEAAEWKAPAAALPIAISPLARDAPLAQDNIAACIAMSILNPNEVHPCPPSNIPCLP